MPKTTAITHADLAPSRRNTNLGSKTGASLAVLTILCGLMSFILCLFAEATRSQATWITSNGEGKDGGCLYNGSGKLPLLSALSAFLILTMTMMIEHTYILICVSKLPSSEAIGWDPDSGITLPWQAGFFFITTWVCFTVAEILLLIGLSIESSHLKDWSRPRTNCPVIHQGLFCAAGVLALATVLLAAGLHLTAGSLERAFQERELAQRQMLEVSVMYASPPRSPRPRSMSALFREDPVAVGGDEHPRADFHSVLAKFSNTVV
ncbi:hypothetical protein MLD38_016371 [Melastoma candidum]|uniref:Uncharacterized protein n=1 Tax=Melastoma candidum TaxID=119954 RepID=A0ACB9RL58_9MYRT|nr:hypothetical protein MLD38_016371 [Melastoma candidum]